ncbi:DUF5000 domain-containing lipoprotein [Dysgonomonas termitidis]|uniref:DUF5000 domain-containing lipoprotein n=1 Tax=Dysgonomonas termitidis TaxID=1516126 RepID=A0ABV9KQ55_9BACT
MKKKKLYILILFVISVLVTGCSEEQNEPLENSKVPPGNITNIQIENQHGKVKLTYTLPKDQDLLYVKAVYTLESGVVREIKSSYYQNTMILDGFIQTSEHEIKVSAVNRSEVESEPVIVKVNPLENPMWEMLRSMKVEGDFSGIKITVDNPYKEAVSIELIKKDSLGNWNPFLPYIYSSSPQIRYITRGLDPVPQEFGLTIRDRFRNYTDTLYTIVTPLYEEHLAKNLFREMKLPGDADIQTVTDGMRSMWDGNSDYKNWNRMLTVTANTNIQWITFDTGQLAKLSRIKIQNYGEEVGGGYQFFYRGQLRHFEIWGSANPNPDGSWDSWTKLGTFECKKPSGLPYGQNSASDFEAGVAGFEYEISSDAPKVRYLRIKSLENWTGTTWFEILEVDVFGDTRP